MHHGISYMSFFIHLICDLNVSTESKVRWNKQKLEKCFSNMKQIYTMLCERIDFECRHTEFLISNQVPVFLLNGNGIESFSFLYFKSVLFELTFYRIRA